MKRTLAFAAVASGMFAAVPVYADWRYHESKDTMRDEKSTFARLTSENTVNFGFPYNGGSQLEIILRKNNGRLDAVMFSISIGQFTCPVSGCKGAVRFDKNQKKGKVESLSLAEPANYAPDLLFASNENWFVGKIRVADDIIVELPFYQYGNVQFEFNVRNLKF